MTKTESRKYDMLLRVRDFGALHAADFPANTVGNRLFTAVAAVVTALANYVVVQASEMVHQSVSSKASIREALLKDLEAISQTAKALAKEIPNLEDKFRMPRGSGDQAILNAAKIFLVDATPLKTAFISYALPQDFLETLQADIVAFETARITKNNNRYNQVRNSASIDEALSKGVQAVHQLKAVVKNLYHNDPVTLAEWKSASHLPRSASSVKSKPVDPKPAPVLPQPSSDRKL